MHFPSYRQAVYARFTMRFYAEHFGLHVEAVRHDSSIYVKGEISPQVLIAGAIGGEDYRLKCFDEEEMCYLFGEFTTGELLFEEFDRVGKWLDSKAKLLKLAR